MMTPYELTPSDEISRRIKRLQEEMAKKEIDLALVIQNVDLFYFSGSIQRGYLFVPSEGEAVFFVEKNYQRAVGETPLKCIQTPSLKALPNLIGEHGFHGSSVGMEFDVIPVAMFNRLKTFFKHWETVDLSREIKKIRSVKSEFEISQIKKAGRIVTQVFSEVKNHLREGVTELELDGILTSIGRALGHQGLLRMRGFNHEMMNIHVLSGTSGSVVSYSDTPLAGHGLSPAIAQGSSIRMIERDQPVVIDYGAGYNGYVTDETRTFVIGRLKGPLEKACRVSLEILEEVESFAKAGVQPLDIYERAQERARMEGLSPYFMGIDEGQVSFVGHGLGLEINEWPILGKGEKRALQSGMVFALEPKFVFPELGAVGIELDYIVRESGLERVTQFPKDVITL
jgi:Xaa-Pro aminopeptidase